jgi:hypothetical protein
VELGERGVAALLDPRTRAAAPRLITLLLSIPSRAQKFLPLAFLSAYISPVFIFVRVRVICVQIHARRFSKKKKEAKGKESPD